MILKIGEKRIRAEHVIDYEPIDESGFDAKGMPIMSFYIFITSTGGIGSTIPFYGNGVTRDKTVEMMDQIFEPQEVSLDNPS